MSTVNIELNGDVLGAFNRLLAANADLGPAWRAIGNLLEESTKRRFGPGIGPDGRRWLPNSPATGEAGGLSNAPILRAIWHRYTGPLPRAAPFRSY